MYMYIEVRHGVAKKQAYEAQGIFHDLAASLVVHVLEKKKAMQEPRNAKGKVKKYRQQAMQNYRSSVNGWGKLGYQLGTQKGKPGCWCRYVCMYV
jgi:hypothetical protein